MAIRFLVPPSLGSAKSAARAELLEQAMTSELGESVLVTVPSSYESMLTLALAADVDIIWGPSAVCARLEPYARGIYKSVRNGRSSYRSALVVRRDEKISLDRLFGLRAAWVDPLSLGGYLLAVDMLQSHYGDPNAQFLTQKFYGSHPDAASAVLQGDADICAVTTTGRDDVSIRRALAMYVGAVAAKRLTSLAVTEEAPTDGVVLTKRPTAAAALRMESRLFPGLTTGAPSFLLSAMEAEALVLARPGEYARVRALIRRREPK